jgi:hypothetical protein
MQVDLEMEKGHVFVWSEMNEDKMVMQVDEEVGDYCGSEG